MPRCTATIPAFSTFLRLRSKALLTDDYYPSDIAWLDLKNPKFDLILAPYETYMDELLGVKASYGGSILIRNEEQSQKLESFRSTCRSCRSRCRCRWRICRPSAENNRRWK
jgi:hypothetical protein